MAGGAANFVKTIPATQCLLAELTFFTIQVTNKWCAGTREIDSLKVGNGIRHIVSSNAVRVDAGEFCRIVGIVFQQAEHVTQVMGHLQFALDRPRRLIGQCDGTPIPELSEVHGSIKCCRGIEVPQHTIGADRYLSAISAAKHAGMAAVATNSVIDRQSALMKQVKTKSHFIGVNVTDSKCLNRAICSQRQWMVSVGANQGGFSTGVVKVQPGLIRCFRCVQQSASERQA